MLINGSRLYGCKILSLHTGSELAEVAQEVVDPDNLKIIAFMVQGPQIGGETGNLLKSSSVREFAGNMGMIIDSVDELVFREDVVHIDEVMRLNFQLNGLKVESKSKKKLGRVVDFIVNTDDFQVVQLIVKRPMMKSLIDPELTISLSDIVEVNDYKIIVKDEKNTVKTASEANEFMPNFVNPFREQNFSPAQNQNPDESNIE